MYCELLISFCLQKSKMVYGSMSSQKRKKKEPKENIKTDLKLSGLEIHLLLQNAESHLRSKLLQK